MIVTTGGRAWSDSSGSSNASGSSSSSSACLIVTSRLTLGSAAISPTASSERDWVMVTISPRPIMILMIDATGIPSACESSLTVTPDWTVTGPVGTTTSRGCFGWRSVRSRAWRESGRGLLACESMTTRRLRRPPPGAWRGRIGLLGRFCPCSSAMVSAQV